MISELAASLLGPRLAPVDWATWERHYPDGFGASAFSSPAWQRLMQAEEGPSYQLRMLTARVGGRPASLPVFVRSWRFQRVEMRTRPISYFVLPIELSSAGGAGVVEALTAQARSPWTVRFEWCLPPWLEMGRDATTAGVATYLMRLDCPREEYLATRVRKRFLDYVRSSYRRGIEVSASPTPEETRQYIDLYRKTHSDRSWVGPVFSDAFFEGVRTSLGKGGSLVIMKVGSKVVGGGVVLFDRYSAHYFQGAIDRDAKEVKPHIVLYDWVLTAAYERGLQYINLGGVNEGNDSLTEFKTNWGATAVPTRIVDFTFGSENLVSLVGGLIGTKAR